MKSRAVSASMPEDGTRCCPGRGETPVEPGPPLSCPGEGLLQISVICGVVWPPRWPSIPLDDIEPPVPELPIPPATLSLIWSMPAWAFSQGPRPAAEPARNPIPNMPSVLMRNSFIASPLPALLSVPVRGTFPCRRGAKPRRAHSEPRRQPFATRVGRRREAIAVEPDELRMAHAVLVRADDLDPAAFPAQAVHDAGREAVLDPDREVACIDDPAGGGEGGGGVGTVVGQAGQQLDLGLELPVGAHRAEHQPRTS